MAVVLLFSGIGPLLSQAYFVVQSIDISGNKWTKQYIVEKELDFMPGDTILLDKLVTRFENNKNRLLNTGLFNQLDLNITNWDTELKTASVSIQIVENWFWYPSPIFELADRSFNEWWYEHNASLKRWNLGIRFMHINMTGNQDKLKFNFNAGFTQKYEVDYIFPYLNKENSIGANFNLLYVTYKEIAFETRDNKLNFIRLGDQNLLNRFRVSFGLNYRKNQSYFHSMVLEYNHKSILDTIRTHLNPNYLTPGKDKLSHLTLDYKFLFTNVDKKIYPRSGYRYLFYIKKEGGILNNEFNYFQLTAAVEKQFRITDNYSSGAKLKVQKSINLGEEIPYYYMKGMGYFDDVISGYQLYVIDGLDYIYLQSTQKFQILDIEYDLNKYMPFRQFRLFPLQLFIGVHGDLGYVGDNRFSNYNSLNNQILYGAALSLDVLVYHNYFYSVEFAINHLGETGIFLKGVNTFE